MAFLTPGRLRASGWFVTSVGLLVLPVDAAGAGPAAPAHRGSLFRGWTDLYSWSKSPGERSAEVALVSPEIEVPGGWHECVVSWNADTPRGTALKVEARATSGRKTTKYYGLGLWSSDRTAQPRASIPGQADGDAEVHTDTLVLKQPADRVQVRVTLIGSADGREPRLRFLGVSCVNTAVRPAALEPNRKAWGRLISVPERSQVSYPGGEQSWCSPTSVSMVLAHWARVQRQPALDRDVPEVVEGVFDPKWPGTGNWPFNTAYAGSIPGLRAYVTRLTDVAELEDWVAADVPVILSVCYDLLRGKPRTRDSGHLVVCVGFTESGQVVVNDPGTRDQVRKTFPRDNLVRAWAHSRNTVYLIHPDTWRPPRDRFQHWFTPAP